ncbi:MAG: hypothetical protein ACI4L1_02650 [Christensenellales bacterium]
MSINIFKKTTLFFLISVILSFVLLLPKAKISCLCATSQSYYAQIVASNVKLYRSTNGSEEISNIFFVIPQTYFVEISSCENSNFFTARYFDKTGYVKKSEVKCVKGIPQTPFANASFRVFIPGGVALRTSPSQSEGLNTVETLPFLETNLRYYGTIDGEEAISHKSSTWYYCKYIKSGSEVFGYVYGAFCDLLTTIPSNTEILEEIEEPDFTIATQAEATQVEESGLSSLPSTTQIIIIVAVCLPCVIIIYLLFKPTKITAKALEDAENKPRRRKKRQRHQDYYEYDE